MSLSWSTRSQPARDRSPSGDTRYGAGCAMGAAALTGNLSHLILYEPGLGIAYPAGWIDANVKALEAGDAEGVIRAVLMDILEMTAEDVEARRSAPQWAEYLRAAPTVLREARTENGWVYRPGALDGVRASTLVLVGTETAPALMQSTLRAAAAIRGARTHVLGGHGHLACITDPALVASIITGSSAALVPMTRPRLRYIRGKRVPRLAIYRPDGLSTTAEFLLTAGPLPLSPFRRNGGSSGPRTWARWRHP